jgi:hypothetical protein
MRRLGTPVPGTGPRRAAQRWTITLEEGSTPPRVLAWLVNDPRYWSDGKVPTGRPAGLDAPILMSLSERHDWWNGKFASSPPTGGPDAPDPMPAGGQPLAAWVERQRKTPFGRRLLASMGAAMSRAKAPRPALYGTKAYWGKGGGGF